MYYSDELIEEIRGQSDIVDVISGYVKLQKKGNSYMGLCPFHNEKSPSFSVSRHKQMYHCFGCGTGGNVFTFLMAYENYTFPEAVKALGERAGIHLPEIELSDEEKKQQSLKQQLLDIHKAAARYYYYMLNQPPGRQGLDYLTGRALSPETIRHFGLGYADKFGHGLYKYLKKTGYSDELLAQSGLITFDEKHGAYDKFWNRVIFPIMDVNNRVIGFGGRVMGDGKPKYLNSPETRIFDKSRNLYALNFARISRKNFFIICEGYMDVIAMHQAGFTNAVASLGTAFTTQHATLIKRYVNEVYLAYDSDGAGVNAALRAIPILKAAGLKIKVIHMNPYKDPDEFIKNLGVEAFNERIENAENSFMFEVSVLEKQYDLNDPQGKTDFFNAVAHKLLEFTQELERNNYIEAISRSYGIEFKVLQKLVNRLGATLEYSDLQPSRTYEPQVPKKTVQERKQAEDGLLVCQRLILTMIADSPELLTKIEKYIQPDDFTDSIYRYAATLLYEEFHQTGNVTPARIIDRFESQEEQSVVASLFNTSPYNASDLPIKEKALNEAVIKIKKYSLEEASKHAADIAALQQIVREKTALKHIHISL